MTQKTLPLGWGISFNIFPVNLVHGLSNILHATIGRDVGRIGYRIPAIWFRSGTTRLHICSAVSGGQNYCYNSFRDLPLFKQSFVIVQQIKTSRPRWYRYQIIVNGIRVKSVINTKAEIFSNVKYYTSDPWYTPAKAVLTNFKLTFFE